MEIIGTTTSGNTIAILTNTEIKLLIKGNCETTEDDRWDSWFDTEAGKLFADYKPIHTKKDLIRYAIRGAYVQKKFDGSIQSLARMSIEIASGRISLYNWGKVRQRELDTLIERYFTT